MSLELGFNSDTIPFQNAGRKFNFLRSLVSQPRVNKEPALQIWQGVSPFSKGGINPTYDHLVAELFHKVPTSAVTPNQPSPNNLIVECMEDGKFTALYRENYGLVTHTAYILVGDVDIAHELAQDTFLKAYTHLRKCDEIASVKSWLKTVVTNKALDTLKRRQLVHFEQFEQSFTKQPDTDTAVSPLGQHLLDEQTRAVYKILYALKPPERLILVLRNYGDLPCEQIGNLVGISRGAVKSWLKRIREKSKVIAELQGLNLFEAA